MHDSLFVFIIFERWLKTKWVIVIVPLIPYFICLGHIPKCCSRPRPNISHYKAASVCVCVCVFAVQPWPLMARVWQRPFVSFMVSSGWGLIICTRLCFTQIYVKLLFSCLIWRLWFVGVCLQELSAPYWWLYIQFMYDSAYCLYTVLSVWCLDPKHETEAGVQCNNPGICCRAAELNSCGITAFGVEIICLVDHLIKYFNKLLSYLWSQKCKTLAGSSFSQENTKNMVKPSESFIYLYCHSSVSNWLYCMTVRLGGGHT